MPIRPDPEPPSRRPAAAPARILGSRNRSRPGAPRPAHRDDASAPPPPGDTDGHGRDGQRGLRTTALLLTTGAIGSTLAALLLASGVLTPTAPREPSGLGPLPPSETSAPPAPPTPVPSVSTSPAPTRPTSAPPASSPDSTPTSPRPRPGGSGVLQPGDSGPAVSDLQARLLRIPDVYPGGKVDGRYDDELARAVARFQQWYGIRGDEEGVYGDDTRRDLESRT